MSDQDRPDDHAETNAESTADDQDTGPRSTAETPPSRKRATRDRSAERDRSTTRKRSKRKRSKRKSSKGSSASSSSRSAKRSLRGPLTKAIGTVGIAVASLDPFAGAVILDQAESIARQLDALAEQSPGIRRVLEQATGAGAGWAGVTTALAPVAIPILWRYGLVPDLAAVRSMVPDAAVRAGIETGALDPDGHPLPPDQDDDDGPAKRRAQAPPGRANGSRTTFAVDRAADDDQDG